MSSMERTLQIVEIFRNICEFADKRTLAALARTCSPFHQTAIQSLWRVLPNLVPLIKCFPAGVWVVRDKKMVCT